MKRAPLKRGWKKTVRPRYSPIASEAWRASVVLGGCVLASDECQGPVQGHHVLPQRVLKREGYEARLWDPRNGIGLCELHHTRHERRLAVVPLLLLPDAAIAFAEEVGLGWWLERFYAPQEQAA